ncbi:4a-hydroxytetrahydrobiopterin dehydratase [Pseudarthrobacter sp. NIBRBAC000502772]|uniref:4a-hydroxytetrahydrobiopterin dehydratase n=1 Tax=Pseudarthrobacter sp. NIBRBAC000502772 TaxID=2590775 RepID=UPI001FEEF66E|nr:4a-hydroxytetrahydrobiopterin dehydratase [Pseudarthrobacter sp. NIBRBAC000502772]
MAPHDDVFTRPPIDGALSGLPNWRYRLGGLVTIYKTPTTADALELIAAVGRLSEEKNHHPDLELPLQPRVHAALPRTTRAVK